MVVESELSEAGSVLMLLLLVVVSSSLGLLLLSSTRTLSELVLTPTELLELDSDDCELLESVVLLELLLEEFTLVVSHCVLVTASVEVLSPCVLVSSCVELLEKLVGQ